MRKPTLFFSVAALAVAAGFGGSAAMACAPGQPPVPAACHIPTNEGGIRDGTCSCTYGVATKSAASLYTAEFVLRSSGVVDVVGQWPNNFVRTVGGGENFGGNWGDGGAWSQIFWVDFISGFTMNCTATAQPNGTDYVSASVANNFGTRAEVRERWTSTPNKFYSDPVYLYCNQ